MSTTHHRGPLDDYCDSDITDAAFASRWLRDSEFAIAMSVMVRRGTMLSRGLQVLSLIGSVNVREFPAPSDSDHEYLEVRRVCR